MVRSVLIFGGAVLLCLWVAAATPLLRAEVKALGFIPSVSAASPGDRARLVLGDAFSIAERAAANVPPFGTVLFLGPRDEGAVGYYSGILKNYLYPRRVRALGSAEAIDAAAFAGTDYLLIFRTGGQWPGEEEAAMVAARISRMVPISMVDSWPEQNGFAALYAIGREAAP